MAQEDDSFNAKGPTVVGFETIGTDIAIGVAAFGTQCGVRGEASGDPILQKPLRLVEDGTGVHGHGTAQGVFGEGAVGVRGLCQFWSGEEVVSSSDAALAAEAPPLLNADAASGVGVRAWSAHNRAGVFQTGADPRPPDFPLSPVTAQIHLVPIPTRTLPRDASAGDLLVIRAGEPPDQVELWFCVKSSGASVASIWKKVSLI